MSSTWATGFSSRFPRLVFVSRALDARSRLQEPDAPKISLTMKNIGFDGRVAGLAADACRQRDGKDSDANNIQVWGWDSDVGVTVAGVAGRAAAQDHRRHGAPENRARRHPQCHLRQLRRKRPAIAMPPYSDIHPSLGHIPSQCYSAKGKVYELIPEDD